MVDGGRSGETIEEVDEVELAVRRIPPMDATQAMNVKTLEGEIHLAKDLQPRCRFLLFSVDVCRLLVHRMGRVILTLPAFSPTCRRNAPTSLARV